jgi:hypothetical protein
MCTRPTSPRATPHDPHHSPHSLLLCSAIILVDLLHTCLAAQVGMDVGETQLPTHLRQHIPGGGGGGWGECFSRGGVEFF